MKLYESVALIHLIDIMGLNNLSKYNMVHSNLNIFMEEYIKNN